VIFPFCSALPRPGVLCPVLGSSVKESELLERGQQKAAKIIKGQKHLSYEGRLIELGLFSLEKTKPKSNLIKVYKYLKGGCKEDGARDFSVVPSGRTRGNGHKLEHRRFHLNMRKPFFTVEGDQGLERITQRGCRVYILRDIQKLSGHIPGQPGLSCPA